VTGPSYTPSAHDPDEVARKKMADDREVRAFVIGLQVQERARRTVN
jgi:hypothetical protein